jgi:hypothetical protein
LIYEVRCEILSNDHAFFLEADGYSKDRIIEIFSEVHPEIIIKKIVESSKMPQPENLKEKSSKEAV